MDILDPRKDADAAPPEWRTRFDVERPAGGSETSEETEASEADERFEGEGMRVVFKDVSYVVQSRAKRREKISLLHDVSGALYPGLMTALMGPSGSGKTTLLDVLAGRKTIGEIKGTILFAGKRPSVPFLRRYTGYVEQHDTLLDNLTVEEQLMYTSELKNSRKEGLARKRQRVDLVIEQLALDSCRHVTIGSALKRGISGGQAKRTNIGIALVTHPRVLFLDEPTSGLDSYTANEVMVVVKQLVKSGMTIVATVHSPTPFSFNLFDRMMILLQGAVVYSGANGMPAVHFFEKTNPDAPRFGSIATGKDNPAEWIVDLTTQADREGRGGVLAEQYRRSELWAANELLVDAEAASGALPSEELLRELNTKRATSNSFLYAMKTILKYRMAKDFCDPAYLGPRLLDKLAIALIVMTLYWKEGNKTFRNPSPTNFEALRQQFTGAQNIGAMLFLWTILPAFTASTYIPSLVLERTVYYRERADGLFSPICYLTAKVLEELLISVLVALATCSLVFYTVRLSGSFALFFLAKFVTSSIGIVLGYLVAAFSPSMEIANAVLPAYVVCLLFFIGLLIRAPDIPAYWKWFMYLNPLHYAWVAQMDNQFGNSTIQVPYSGPILVYYGIEDTNKWQYLGFEAIFLVGFYLLAWFCFAFIKHQKR